MRHIGLLILMIGLAMGSIAHAQNDNPIVISIGSSGQEYGKAVAIDSQNNVVVATLYENTIDVDPSVADSTLTASGLVDTAVIWYSPQGDYLRSVTLGGRMSLDVPHGVAVDSQDNVYVTGYAGNVNNPTEVVFGGIPQTTLGHFDVYLAKYNSQGVYQWAIIIGSQTPTSEERAWDIAIDQQDRVIIAGAFDGTMDVNPLGEPLTISSNAQGVSLFVATYDSNGQAIWARGFDAGLTDVFTEAYAAVDTDSADNVIVAGNFRGMLSISDQSLTSQGETDIFVATISPTGDPILAYSFSGAGRDIVSPGAMRVNTQDQTVLTGRIMGSVDFDPRDGVTTVSNAGGGGDTFVAMLQSDQLIWAFNVPSPVGLDGGHRVDFDSAGNVYVAGWFRGSANFAPMGGAGNVVAQSTDNASDIFLAKYGVDGSFQWVQTGGAAVSGAQHLSIVAGLAIDSDDGIWVTGQYFGMGAQFGSVTVDTVGENDTFVIKYQPDGSIALR